MRFHASIPTEISTWTRLLNGDVWAIVAWRTGNWKLGSRAHILRRIKDRDGLRRAAAFSTLAAQLG